MIIYGDWVVLDYEKVIRDGAVVVEDNVIVDIGPRNEINRRHSGAGHDKIGGRNKLVIPGLINSHTHISMTLLRGYADDLLLQEWLEKYIWPFESKLTGEDIELGALLGAVESIAGGVTNVCTMYHYHPDKNELTALLRVGLRGTMGIAIFSWDAEGTLKNFRDAVRRYHGRDGLVRVASSPHAPYTVSPDLWREAEAVRRELQEKYGEAGPIIMTTHIAEDWREPQLVKERFGVEVPDGSIMKYLDKLGVLSGDVLAAHAIHVNDIDLSIMVERDVKVAHNPVANMKLGMGYADTPKMLSRGLKVSLGTDGPASNNTLDLVETMKVAALINKPIYRDPRITSAREVFRMATEYGAVNLGYNNLGRLEKGFLADIVVIDLARPNSTPIYDIYSHIIYSLRSGDVETTIVNGVPIYLEREFTSINVEELLERVRRRVSRLTEIIGGVKDAD